MIIHRQGSVLFLLRLRFVMEILATYNDEFWPFGLPADVLINPDEYCKAHPNTIVGNVEELTWKQN